MRSNAWKFWVAAASCSAMWGCAATQQVNQATLECGGVGVAAGYVLCKVSGKSDRDCLATGAVIGVGGAAVCYVYSSNLEKRREALRGKENDLDARIAYVNGLNQDTTALNASLRHKVSTVTANTDTLVAQIKQRQVSAAEITKARQERDSELTAARQQVAKSDDALREVRTYRSTLKQPSADLDVAIAKQQALYDDARHQVDLLAAQRARV